MARRRGGADGDYAGLAPSHAVSGDGLTVVDGDTSGPVPFIDTESLGFAYGDTATGERVIDSQYTSSTLYVSEDTRNGDGTVTDHASNLMWQKGDSVDGMIWEDALAWVDVYGAGSQRSDPKVGDPSDYPTGHGPQGDAIRIYNHVRCVRAGVATKTTGASCSAVQGAR